MTPKQPPRRRSAPARRRSKPAPRKASRPPVRRRKRRRLTLGSSTRRLNIGFAAIAVVVLVLGGRLVQLQGLDAQTYALASEQSRLRTSDLEAERGQILDRDGGVLAYSVDSHAVYADPSMVKEPFTTAQKVAPILGLSTQEVQEALVKPTRFVYLARGVDPKLADEVMKLELPGIATLPEPERMHPARTVGANVVGFTDRDGHGQGGIEKQYDDLLSGKPGQLTVEVGTNGEIIPSGVHKETEAQPGADVQLTISQDLQYIAQAYLDAAVDSTKAQGGQVSVLDAKTGEVLALASSDTYDASDPGATPDDLFNPNVSNYFEPGSANKVIAFAAALEKGLITPTTKFNVPGSIPYSDVVIHDAWSHDPIDLTATGILSESSNVGTVQIAEKLGAEAWMEYAKRFGEGEKTGVELPGETGGVLPDRADWSGSTFGNLPIGQGVAVTSLQLASIYQAIANDGVRIPPRIVKEITDPDGNVDVTGQPDSVQVMQPQTAKTLRNMLQMVTQEGGTGVRAAIPGYNVAGKTGTGQKVNPDCGCYDDEAGYWSTFAGMAPADDPQYVISVMVDSPQTSYHGGDVAAPLFKEIMTYALKHGQVPPTGAKPAQLPVYPE